MAKNLVYLGVIVLAVIAVALGYKIYQQQTGAEKQSIATKQQASKSPTPKSEVNQATPNASLSQTPSATEISAVLNFPGPNATDAEKKAHSDLVNKLGNQSGGAAYLDISGCKPNPIVYRVRQGGTFKVKASDQNDHTISTDRRITIRANSEQTLQSKDIGDNLGNYGYGCDNSTTGSVGIIQIIP